MSQPLDRNRTHEVLGELDRDRGEFWESSPFDIANKGENLSAFERNRVYLNREGRAFVDASFASQADIDSDSRSVIHGDFDGDGTPDLLVGSVGGGPLRLFLNEIEQGNRLRVELIGDSSNRRGIGARVVAMVGDTKIVRDLFQQNGCMGLGPVSLSIGVGKADKIDTIRLRWPSGKKQELADVPVAETLTIREPDEETSEQSGD